MTASKRLVQYLGLAALFGLLPMLVLAAPPADPQGPGKIDARLADEIAINGRASFWIGMAVQADLSAAYDMDWEARGWYVYRTLARTAEETQASVAGYLEDRGLEYESFWINNSIYVHDGDLAAIQDLAARRDVLRIKADEVYALPEPPPQVEGTEGTDDSWGLDWVHAPEVWALGIDGSGVVVASIDTGVQYDHPQLFDTYRGTIDGSDEYNWCDPSDVCAGDEPCDNNGHGTHTMGTMSGENDDPAVNPNLIGMAPGSTWIACKGCEFNTCSDSALLECAEWMLAPTSTTSGSCADPEAGDPGKRPDVVNNSWGEPGGRDWFLSSVQAWRAAGIFPAFSAGNEHSCGTLGSPGDYQESFASANHTSSGTINPSYSSRGPSDFGWAPYCKPNVAAPGTSICSSVPRNGYACNWTGTSMASPHSAGTVALVWQACPELVGQIDLTFQVLQNTARKVSSDFCSLTSGCNNVGCNCTYGYGYLDALAAVESCTSGLHVGHLTGHVYDLDSGQPIKGAGITVSSNLLAGSTVEDSTDPNGFYTLSLLPGTYTVAASKNGYVPEKIGGVEIVTDTVTEQDFSLEFVGLWTEVDLPDPRPVDLSRFDGAFDPHDNLIYFPGGRSDDATQERGIWIYDPQRDEWTDTGCDLNQNASNYTVAYVEDDGTGRGEALYVVGGWDVDTGENIDAVQRYYPSEPGCLVEEVATDPFPGKVSGKVVGAGGIAVVGGKIYTFGGWETQLPPYFSDETWVFDPKAAAGSRWTEIVSATLHPGRCYIDVAVQDGLIYALGGVDGYGGPGSTLVSTDVAEVFDPGQPDDGWLALADLPAASGEGRGFGFQADTLSLDQPAGKVYVVGGGQWPYVSPQVLEYDAGSDTWNPYFPSLNAGRRDFAGATASVCTPDLDDGLPGMWAFGGILSASSDEPPYGSPEFFGFPCEEPEPPEAAFSAGPAGSGITKAKPVSGCAPLAVQFTDVSSGTVLERYWDFGDGTGTATKWRPVHVYEADGSFKVTLAVSNTSGSDTASATVVVSVTPQAAFTYTAGSIYTDTLVHFDDTSSGPVVEWLWTFSDGDKYEVQNPAHTFTDTGTYTVTLAVSSDQGCSSATSREIEVNPRYRHTYLPTFYRNH